MDRDEQKEEIQENLIKTFSSRFLTAPSPYSLNELGDMISLDYRYENRRMSSIMRISCYLMFLTAKGHEKDTPSPNPSQNKQIDIILISPPEISEKSFLMRAFEDIKCQLNENVMSWVSCHVLQIEIALVN